MRPMQVCPLPAQFKDDPRSRPRPHFTAQGNDQTLDVGKRDARRVGVAKSARSVFRRLVVTMIMLAECDSTFKRRM